MASACITAKGPGDLVFIDDITEDGSSIMDGSTYRKILGKYIEPNGKKLVGRVFIVQSDNDPKHTAKASQEFIAKKKWKLFNWPSQSPNLNLNEHIFHLLTGYKNVFKNSGRFVAQYKVGVRPVYLGLFDTAVEAAVVVDIVVFATCFILRRIL